LARSSAVAGIGDCRITKLWSFKKVGAEDSGCGLLWIVPFTISSRCFTDKARLKLIEEIGGESDPLDAWYCQIVKEGTEGDFRDDTNEHWTEQTRPILEAFWHTKYFLSMMAKYGKELQSAPRVLPSGWASVLCLFSLR
jgi:hypothetical protein